MKSRRKVGAATSRRVRPVVERMLADPQTAVLNWLTRYVVGEVTLGAFNRWFVPFSWGSDNWQDPNATELAARIEFVLAEFSNSHRTEDEVRTALRAMLLTISWSLHLGVEATAIPTFGTTSFSEDQESPMVVPTAAVTAEAGTKLMSVA